MNKLVKTVNKDDLITEFLTSLNGILRLTDRELELMAELIRLDINYNKLPNEHKNIANRQNRKHIIQTLGITKDNLSRYIKAFKEKGILIAGPAEDELSDVKNSVIRSSLFTVLTNLFIVFLIYI
jgi:hypothetical protein